MITGLKVNTMPYILFGGTCGLIGSLVDSLLVSCLEHFTNIHFEWRNKTHFVMHSNL